MQKTKLIIALVVVAALTLTIVGLASAQVAATQNNPGTTPNNGFWGWMRSCFGLRNSQPYANQYDAPPASTNVPVPTPNQGNGYYFGFGPCMARFNPIP
jgi:hypothetical protein